VPGVNLKPRESGHQGEYQGFRAGELPASPRAASKNRLSKPNPCNEFAERPVEFHCTGMTYKVLAGKHRLNCSEGDMKVCQVAQNAQWIWQLHEKISLLERFR
jgi:hypothetical protein